MTNSALFLALVLGLGSTPATAEEVVVFAAASLADALEEIADDWERTNGVEVVLSLGASSTLARQIEEGAPADLFLSADEAQMDRLAAKGLIRTESRRSVLSNTLVVVVPVEGGPRVRVVGDLAAPAIERLALADPAAVPAGVYARRYLERLGLWPAVAPKVIPAENVRGALAAVEAGNADAGIVYRTDARISPRVRVAIDVPREEGPAISYPFALIARAPPNPATARFAARSAARFAARFLEHLGSPTALAVFERYGFLVAAPSVPEGGH